MRGIAETKAVRFYFDIHYGGKVHVDGEGEEFDTLEDAQAHVLSTAAEFHRRDQRLSRKVILYARIEITDRQGISLTVPMANILRHWGWRHA